MLNCDTVEIRKSAGLIVKVKWSFYGYFSEKNLL